MKLTLTLALLLLFTGFAIPTDAHLLPSKDGRMSGMVLDVNDARVAGAKVTIEAPNYKRELLTAPEGEFHVNLPPGKYTLTVDANGFCKFERDSFQVASDVTEMLNIHLEVAVYDSVNACKCSSRSRRNSSTTPNKSLDARRDSSFLN